MFETFTTDLNNLKEIFDKEDISSYSLLLIKLYQIFKECNSLSEDEQKNLGNLLKEILDKYNLNKMITVQDLNKIFNPIGGQIDINDKENYLTIFNIILEQLRSGNQVLSFKVEEIIQNLLQEIEKSLNENEVLTQNSNDEVAHFINEKEFINIEDNNAINLDTNTQKVLIRNKSYLNEYIRQKNLLPYKCAICGLTSWQNNPLLLKLDSLNDEYSISNLKNLRYLCPNCYSQFGNELNL